MASGFQDILLSLLNGGNDKMKLSDLVSKIDIDKVAKTNNHIYNLLEMFGVDYCCYHDKVDAQDRLFSEYVSVSYCTDTWVGLMVYVFDGEVVAFSSQIGRKFDEEFYWVSREVYNKVKEFCLSFARVEEDLINIIDDEEIDDEGYKLHYSGEIVHNIHKGAKLDGEVVNIVKNADPKDYISNRVIVICSDDKLIDVRIDHLVFPYLCLKEQ